MATALVHVARRRFVALAGLAILAVLQCITHAAVTEYVVAKATDGSENKGFKPGSDGKVHLKLDYDSLTEDQKRLARAALAQWASYKTADGKLGNSNCTDRDPPAENIDVMSGEALQDGTTSRNLTNTDIEGMKHLYGTADFVIEDASSPSQANLSFRHVVSCTPKMSPN